MKDVYKNPNFYYILVPAVLALWPLLIGAVYLPSARSNFEQEQAQYDEAQKTITEILTLDPDRLQSADAKGRAAEFEYATEVDKVARSCGIPPSACELSSKPTRTSKGQTTQSCRIALKEVDIATLARFLSELQLRWVDLHCETIMLTKLKGLPDSWKVDLNFKYYY
ncbi:MAG: hypothetical protein ACYTEQ_09920 [Planctomycetota bacterium]|jgi:hypothetical protein